MNISDALFLLPVKLPCSRCPWESGLARAVACANLPIVQAQSQCGHCYLSVAAVFHYSLLEHELDTSTGLQAGLLGLQSSAEGLNCFQLLLRSRSVFSRESHSWALHFSTCFLPESSNQPYSYSCSTRAERIFPDACELLRAHQQAQKFFQARKYALTPSLHRLRN